MQTNVALHSNSAMRPGKKHLRPATEEGELARSEAAHLLGEFSELLRQVGSPAQLEGPSSFMRASAVRTMEDVTSLVEEYFAQVLIPIELPAVAEACRCGQCGEARELVDCDKDLSSRLRATPFAEPSRQIGRLQLTRMRPMRDERTVRRYLAAVESGDAGGWHPLVYGLTLAVYSLPLRQGLLFYGRETLTGLAVAAGIARGFGEEALIEAVRPLLDQLPAAVEAVLESGVTLAR